MGIQRKYPVALMARNAAIVAACLALANCASSGKFASRVDPKYGVSSSPRVVAFGEPVPKGGGTYRDGKPYTVARPVHLPERDTEDPQGGSPRRAPRVSSAVGPAIATSSTPPFPPPPLPTLPIPPTRR